MTYQCPRREHPGLGQLDRLLPLLVGALLLLEGKAQAQRLSQDPVEKFRQALLLEDNKKPRYKTGLDLDPEALAKAKAFREKNLTKAAEDLRTLSDLGEALLLVEWPQAPNPGEKYASEYDKLARGIERTVREKMAKRFSEGAARVLKSQTASSASKVAVANLLGEMVVQTSTQVDERLKLSQDLKDLAKVLAEQVESSGPKVRVAIARALGQFPNEPETVGAPLRKMLEQSNDLVTRQAAAESLYSLSLSVTNSQPIRGSEPGVIYREVQRTRQFFSRQGLVDVVTAVSDAAVVGLTDSDVKVRQRCMSAIRHCAGGFAFDIRVLVPQDKDTDNPPKARTDLSADEKKALEAARAAVREDLAILTKALNRYRKLAGPLAQGMRDSDSVVRAEARRAIEEVASARQAFLDLKQAIPDSGKAIGGEARRSKPASKGGIRLTSGTQPAEEVPVTRLPGLPVLKAAPPGKEEKAKGTSSDDVSTFLSDIAAELLTEGQRDSDAPARRAAHMALEAMGDGVIPHIPQLVKSLKDKDPFVRWITARTFRKLAEEDERRDRKSQHAEVAIRALIAGLNDEDLDARIHITRALGAYGPEAASAVTPLSRLLEKGDAEYRVVVVKALESIGEDSKSALPTLVKLLTDPDARLRAESARLIGRLAKYSSAYVSELEKLTSDPDPKVREQISAAILSIQEK